ncbi:MAG: dephospho-CoA kinase [Planctomycetota bacterium]
MAQGRGKIIIGLAGGIGAGKSTIARILRDNGAAVIDSDQLSHQELDEPEVIETLVGWFGERLRGPDGKIHRALLSEVVFDDARERALVEGLLHPRVARRRRELIVMHDRDPEVRAIVIDSPLLFETGLHELCDVVLFVEASAENRRRRVAARGWSDRELSRREKLQKPLDTKKSRADHILANNSGLDDLRADAEVLFCKLLAGASGG